MRGMEACKAEQDGQKREKEEAAAQALEHLRAELDAYEARSVRAAR